MLKLMDKKYSQFYAKEFANLDMLKRNIVGSLGNLIFRA